MNTLSVVLIAKYKSYYGEGCLSSEIISGTLAVRTGWVDDKAIDCPY